MENLFILAGPTAVGKTDISIKLAKKLNGEIISADSMQIYKQMDIGSAKIKMEEMNGIPHYMIDIVDPLESFNVSQFKKMAQELIKDIISRGKIPMLVGGTGLYINSLICNYDFTEADTDERYREYIQNLAKEKGREFVHSLLKDVDEESYIKLFPNDLKRVTRALEVYKLTGKTMGEFNNNNDIYDIPYNIAYFILNMDRELLYQRINKRVDLMLEQGLIDEVKKLKHLSCTGNMQSMKGIGYKEMLCYLDGTITLEEAEYLIKKGSRNYAKRQLTWFRKDNRSVWVDKSRFSNEDEIVSFIYHKTLSIFKP